MRSRINKVAVLGSGIMGSGIAAQLANAGVPCLMLDIVPPKFTDEDAKAGLKPEDKRFRNKFALKGLEAVQKGRPALLYSPKSLPLIEVGNFEDDLQRLAECDWVIEVVVERLDIKRKLFEKVEKVVRPGTIVSSNTSGLPISKMVRGRGRDFRKNFLVTHFFNPVRYMYLLELVKGKSTDKQVVKDLVEFGTFRLGKGIVFGKDTPNFVANRVGVFGMMATLHATLEMGYRFDEVDAITGPALGRPKSASFGTADLVGLDTFVHVVNTLAEGCPEDEGKWAFAVPELLTKMVAMGALGRKTGAGFFKQVKKEDGKKEVLVLDPMKADYVPQAKPDIPSLKAVKGLHRAADRICTVTWAEDRAGAFAWRVLRDTLAYAAFRIPEIADTVVAIDEGLRWGFNWDLGPFEVWDALGVEKVVQRMNAEGKAPPAWVGEMLAAGCPSFYREGADGREYYDLKAKGYKLVPKPKSFMILRDIKRKRLPVLENPGASLVDLGDGIACIEFHSATQPNLNPIDDQIIEIMLKGIAKAESDFRGLVIHHQAEQFCAGANLAMLLEGAKTQNWTAIDKMVRDFQAMTTGMRRAKIPVVTAPFGFTFGGGAEIVMGGDRVCAAAETYMGLIEVGVGLLPAGGGHLFMLERVLENVDTPVLSNLPFIQRAFETIAMAKVSTSGEDARALKYLRTGDFVEIQRGRQLYTAKHLAMAIAERGYVPALPKTFALPGKDGVATFRMLLHNMALTHWVTEHDAKIASHVANILCGGDTTINNPVSEQTILDLEREAFLSLCGEEKTQARIQHMLERGKPLRN